MANDKPNSVLTAKQREFLEKTEGERENDYSRQARSYHRQQIRERVQAAFHDFSLLWKHLDVSERNEIFYPSSEKRVELHTDLIDTIAFLYLFLEGNIGDESPGTWRLPFKEVVEPGVRSGEKRRHPSPGHIDVDVELSVEVETTPTTIRQRAVEEIAKGNIDKLSDAEIRSLLHHSARETTMDDGVTKTIDGEPLEEALDGYHPPDLHGLADAVEEKAKELEEDENTD